MDGLAPFTRLVVLLFCTLQVIVQNPNQPTVYNTVLGLLILTGQASIGFMVVMSVSWLLVTMQQKIHVWFPGAPNLHANK